MKAVIQRAGRTTLSVENKVISEISSGLAVYLGIKAGDTEEQAQAMAKRIAALRVFEDGNGKMNLSVKDIGGEILLISQFTLYGDCSHGNRPSFTNAERPEKAEPLYEYVADLLRGYGILVKQGVFGADMKIQQYNDGPVTIIYEI
ncbi:MAG: D-tyrosyl-tRNA(Tyr) deacylase [Clostridia bacterium]|nr:D-tyrosyl-tRNA(Tyr) deacylase [Clostridia bacterium]